MISKQKTITTTFMVPTLNIPSGHLKKNDFINAYSLDKHHEFEYKDCVYLLFQPKFIQRFMDFLDSEYNRTSDIVADYDYDDGYVVIVYKLDSGYSKDFDLIRQGKYSKTSRSFQKLFPRVTKIRKNGLNKDELSVQYRIFNKTKDLVHYWEKQFDVKFSPDQEVWTGFYIEQETLDIVKFKEFIQTFEK